MSFMKNGKWLGVAYRVRKELLGGRALFPHVLVKNCAIEFNFGQREDTYFSVPPGFTFIQHLPMAERVRGTLGPKSKAECEVRSCQDEVGGERDDGAGPSRDANASFHPDPDDGGLARRREDNVGCQARGFQSLQEVQHPGNQCHHG